MRKLSEEQSSHFVGIEYQGKKMNIHYNDVGDGQQCVVMLHGSGPGATAWANFVKNIEPLVEAGYRVLLIDMPGWGQSDPVISTGSRSELNADFLEKILDALGVEQAHLIGNSMGAHTVTAFALRNPQRIKKLVMMGGGTAGVSPFVPQPAEGIKRINALYREPTLENLKAMMAVFVYDASHLTEDLYQMRLNNMLTRKEHLENYAKSLDANPKPFTDYSTRLHEIKAPTLIIWGRDDRFVPMDTGLRLLAGIPHAQLHVYSQCGHWAQWEHAEHFNRMVIDFLQM